MAAPCRGRVRCWGSPRWLLVVLASGWAGVAVGVVVLLLRWLGLGWQPLIVLTAFTPLLLAAPVAGGVVLALSRHWVGAVVALAIVIVGVGVQAPLFVSSHRSSGGVALVLLQANLRVGAADPGDLVRRIVHEQVDVVTLEELTPAELVSLSAAGIDAALPYRLATPYPGGAGTAIFSRYPLRAPVKHDEFRFEVLSAAVAVPGAVPLEVFAVHLLPPWPYPSGTWQREMRHLSALLHASGARSAVLASGDFNATLDHAQFRHLLHGGFYDAAEQVGSGFTPTYPTDRPFPPLLALDHVLCRGLAPTALRRVPLPGSDHRGLLVHLDVARG